MGNWAEFGVEMIVAMWLISSFVTDILITTTLVWDLVSRAKYLHPFFSWG